MAIANELTINATASALDLAQTMFGDGITVVSATYSGDPTSVGIYSGALSTIPGIVPSDSGVILSTGDVTNFTNSSGTTDTNTASNTGTDQAGGVDGDAQLNTLAGEATFDGAILSADFIPTGDMLTMQFVFSSEEYPEYVNAGVNDSFGVWVNGQFVEATISIAGNISIDTVNQTSNQNLYRDNTADQFNTEMDGFTYVLSFKASVTAGQVNTIKIGVADGGDAIFDSNLLIMGDSIQTFALAMDDTIQLTPNSSRTFDILANDRDLSNGGLTITHLNGTAVVVGQTVTLATGEQVRLNADGTVTVFSDADVGTNTLTYSIVDSEGNTDVGYVFVKTVATAGPDGIVEGTAGADVIDGRYLGDPDGDMVDANDGLGVFGTVGDDDYIMAGAGNDLVTSGAANDIIYAGTGDDTVFGGVGDDWADLGAGNDSYGTYGADSAGNDTIYGGAGDDSIIGGAGEDVLKGGSGSDTLSGGIGNDTLSGDADADQFDISDDHGGDTLYGGETTTAGGSDNDRIAFSNFLTSDGVSITFTGAEAGTYGYSGGSSDTTGQFAEIESLSTTDNADQINAAANTANATYSGNGGNDSIIGGSGQETIYGGSGSDTVTAGSGDDLVDLGDGNDSFGGWTANDSGNDTIAGGMGNDTINAGSGNDSVMGGDGNDMLYGSSGDDTLIGDAGDDRLYGGTGNDISYGGAGNDTLQVVDSDQGETLYGGADTDHVQFSTYSSTSGVNVTLTAGAGAGSFAYAGTPGAGSFSEIESFGLTEYGDSFDGSASTGAILVGAGGGNDTLRGGLAADTLMGDADADVIYGGAGDSVIGGEGVTTGSDNDTLVLNYADVASISYDTSNSESGTVIFYGGGTLQFSQIENILYAGPVDGTSASEGMGAGYTDFNGDQVDGTDGLNDTIFGNAGNDTINAGAGNDLVYGGSDSDVILAQSGNDTLYGDAGDDTLQSGSGNDLLNGGAGSDLVQVYANAGNDTVIGGESDETGPGDILNLVTGTTAATVTFTGNETGSVSTGTTQASFSEIETIWTDEGNDTIDGTATSSGLNLWSGGGDDSVIGGSGNDALNAGSGNDSASMGAGQDTVDGGAGNDTLYGGAEADSLLGGDGADLVDGGAGDDLLYGDAPGQDTAPAPGTFTFGLFAINSGGMPIDNWVTYVNGTSTFNGGADVTMVSVSDDETGFEDYGAGGNSPVDGGAPQLLTAPITITKIVSYNAGVPVYGDVTFPAGTPIYAVAQSDITNLTTGEAGNAWVIQIGSDNTNIFYGYDIAVHDGDQLNWLSDNGGAQTPMFADVTGLAYGDLVMADGQPAHYNDTLSGGAGNDLIHGNIGDDDLDGGSGNDTLFGDDGADSLLGGDDRDLIFGGIDDVVDGGEGGDDFDTLDLSAWGHAATNILYDVNNPENGAVEFLDTGGNVIGTMTFANIEAVVACFTPGAMILTDQGEIAVDDLQPGDRVLTRDHGYQPIRWIGRRDMTAVELLAEPRFNPVSIAAGALGAGMPHRDMLVSPQHRILITGARSELLFGEHEILVAAKHLVGQAGIEQRLSSGVSYLHILFDAHEIVRADGAWSESFRPGAQTLNGMEEGQRSEILALFPELQTNIEAFPTARLALKGREARVLIGA